MIQKLWTNLAVCALCLSATALSAQTHSFDSAAFLTHYGKLWHSKTLETPYQENISEQEKIAGLSRLWMEAKINFINFDLVPRLNWDSLYMAYIPRVQKTTSTQAYYRELQSFIHHLKDGHTLVLEPKELMAETRAMVPMLVVPVEGKAVIWKVLDERLKKQGVQEGMIVTSVDGIPVLERMRTLGAHSSYSTPQDSAARHMVYGLTNGNVAKAANLELLDKKGKVKKVEAARTDYFAGNLFPRPVFEKSLEFSILPGNIGYLQLHTFNNPDVVTLFDSLFTEISKTDALIIDVRTNGGGNGGYGHEILGCLTDKPFNAGQTFYLNYQGVKRPWGSNPYSLETFTYDWKPYKNKLYNKPLILLTSPLTYSAAEDFTLAFINSGRGIVVGDATGGSTGQPVFFMLPGGGFGVICAKRDMFISKQQFVGFGIQPDVPVALKLKDLQNGKDTQLEKAKELLKKGIYNKDQLSRLQ